MKIIDNDWGEIIQVNYINDDDSYVQFQRYKNYNTSEIDSEVYYVKFIDKNRLSFKNRLRTFFDIRKNWKSCINGNYQVENGILFSPTQLFELYDYLYKDAYNHNILDLNDQYKINKWKPPVKFEKYPWFENDKDFNVWILFKSSDDLVFSGFFREEKDKKNISFFGLSWAYYSNITKKDIKRYTRRFLFNSKNTFLIQEYEIFLTKQDLITFLSILKYLIDNIHYEKDSYIIKDL